VSDTANVQKPSILAQFVRLLVIIIPFAGLIAAGVLMWGWGFDWLSLVLFLVMYIITGMGITVGYHRLFTHRSFETHPVIKAMLGIAGSMAVEGTIMQWVADHRMHHQHSDQHGDPHSPNLDDHGILGMIRGLWHAHMGWFFKPNMPEWTKYVGDLRKSKLISVISALFPLWVAVGLIVPALLGGLISLSWSGAVLGLVWGGLVRIFLVHHVTWSINSVCHMWGSRPFETNDLSRNNLVFGILAFGEGWHNNHHAFPTSAKHGLRWWQIDTSYWAIRIMGWFGLAWSIKKAEHDKMVVKRRARGAEAS
jgi:stearoyl-CoA desaturase (delta-9 desaturase)